VPAPDSRSEMAPALAEALRRLDSLIEAYETEPDPAVQERAFALLQSVDAVHRFGLTRLAVLLEEFGGAIRERALADTAVRLLLEMYDLLPAASPPRNGGFIPLEDVAVIPARPDPPPAEVRR
jgi:hypothetical protein